MTTFFGIIFVTIFRPKTPTSLEDAQRVVAEFVTEYNCERLHSAIGYIAPIGKLQLPR